MSAVAKLFEAVHHAGDRVAFRCGVETLTYAELDRASRAYAAGLLALGVKRGDRIASLLPSGLPLVVSLMGAYRVGAVHVPINTRYREAEIDHILRDSGASHVVVDASTEHPALLDALPAAPPRIVVGADTVHAPDARYSDLVAHAPLEGDPVPEDEDLALLIYTSGTTGKSKGVQLPFRAVVANIDALTSLWRWTPDDHLVLALPLFHVHGLGIGVHGTLLRGCEATILPRFDARAVAQVMESGGTIFMGVPTMYALLAQAMDEDAESGGEGVSVAKALAKARLLTSGSAALSVNLFERFERETGHRILERYGMSETLLTLSNPYPPDERRRGSVGRAVPGGEVRVVDEGMADVLPGEVGQIVVRGASVMTGYWGQPEKTAESFRDGWFLTGDAATIDEDGYVSIVGRRSVDILKSGGFKISAREIEEVVERVDGVREVAVVGLPDPTWGERIAAFVVADAPSDALARAIETHTGTALAAYKQVREVRFVDALPRNALGKVQKHRLRDTH